MTARATIHGRSSENALLIPITALRSDSDGQYVYRKSEDGLEKVYVKTGITSSSSVEITSGLSDGDQIVTSGTVNISSDTKNSSSKSGRPPMMHG